MRLTTQIPCVNVSKPDGTYYGVPVGVSFTLAPGEIIVGRSQECAKQPPKILSASVPHEDIYGKLKSEGVPIGSAIAWITKKLGIKQCASCVARRLILDNIARVGWTETVRQIKETFND